MKKALDREPLRGHKSLLENSDIQEFLWYFKSVPEWTQGSWLGQCHYLNPELSIPGGPPSEWLPEVEGGVLGITRFRCMVWKFNLLGVAGATQGEWVIDEEQ